MNYKMTREDERFVRLRILSWRGPITHRRDGTGGARVLLEWNVPVATLDTRVVAKVSIL